MAHQTISCVCIFIIIFSTCCLSIRSKGKIEDYTQKEGDLQLYTIKNAQSRESICNDGTDAGYYVRKGVGSGSNKWVVHLEGGWWCWDSASCADRWKTGYTLMSSKWLNPTFQMGGILSNDATNNPDWYNANAVFVPYCSSDTWSGDASKDDNGEWHFRGKKILKALIEDLTASFGLQSAELFLFTGCSAGGQGVIVNADYIAGLLPNTSTQYAAVADAGWLMNIHPLRTDVVSIEQQSISGLKYWKGVVDVDCANGNPGNEWMCYVSPYAAPYITSHIMVQAEQYDGFQLPFDCCSPPFKTNQTEAFVQELRTAFIQSMKIVRAPSTVFSAACFAHCLLEDDQFWNVRIKDPQSSSFYSMRDVLGNWVYNRNGPKNMIDECEGWNCSQNCPA